VHIAPLLNAPGIDFIGEIAETQKSEFLGNALGLLFPISWPEPFGLVMIEAMACGTPVIAFNCGSVPEVIRDGINGFAVETVEEACKAINALKTLDRAAIRADFENRFSVEVMAQGYEEAYRSVLGLADGASRLRESQPSNASRAAVHAAPRETRATTPLAARVTV
jgi:glycosyltransferase involved in cell wall biosynthesis